MIRDFRLLYKLNCIFNSSSELFQHFMSTFDATKVPCPFCNTKEPHWEHHAFYERYIIEFINSKIIVNTVTITRLRCGSCIRTHAVLPVFFIPYSSYSLTFVLTVLNQFFSRTQTVEALCSS